MSELDFLTLVVLAAAGILAGVINAVAGGASFVSFPVLLWAGLNPLAANVTNMVALLPSNLAALPAYRAQLRKLGRTVWPSFWMGVAGGVAGAALLLALGEGLFASAVPWLMAAATFLFAFAPRLRAWVTGSAVGAGAGLGAAGMGLVFLFAIYGGYFGAGVGQIMLAALIVVGYDDFHDANALKNLTVGAISIVAVAVVIFSGQVHWAYALIMAVGSAIGGYFGGSASQMVPQIYLRWGIIAFGVILTVYFFIRGA